MTRGSDLETDGRAHCARIANRAEVAGVIAHELNQPLAAILGNAQALEVILDKAQPDLAAAREITRDIIEDNGRAVNLMHKLDALFTEHGDAQPLDVNACVNRLLDLQRGYLEERSVTVRTELAPGRPHVLADQVQLQQALLNVLLNACEAMSEVAIPERIVFVRTLLTADDPAEVELEIEDRGPGVPRNQLQSIFAPFITTKHQGLGLGLFVSRLIASANGGRIWASANAHQGLTIHIRLRACGADRG